MRYANFRTRMSAGRLVFLIQSHVKMSQVQAAAKKFTSYYRVAGLGYLEYVSLASTALRKVMKEPQRTEALSRSNFKFREFTYAADGKESAAKEFFSDPSMNKGK